MVRISWRMQWLSFRSRFRFCSAGDAFLRRVNHLRVISLLIRRKRAQYRVVVRRVRLRVVVCIGFWGIEALCLQIATKHANLQPVRTSLDFDIKGYCTWGRWVQRWLNSLSVRSSSTSISIKRSAVPKSRISSRCLEVLSSNYYQENLFPR
jgi:hypothetical protein